MPQISIDQRGLFFPHHSGDRQIDTQQRDCRAAGNARASRGRVQQHHRLARARSSPRIFNLSQLESTDELLSALYQVRDTGLGGKIPLVFWDEFETRGQG